MTVEELIERLSEMPPYDQVSLRVTWETKSGREREGSGDVHDGRRRQHDYGFRVVTEIS